MTGERSVHVSFGATLYSLDAIAELIRKLGPVDGDDLGPLGAKLGLPPDAFQLKAVADLLGIAEEPRELPELYSAVRRLLAAEAPITVVFENVQNAGPAFFNLVSYLEGVLDNVVIETRRGPRPQEMSEDPDTLRSEGLRALRRSDMPAAHAFLARAAALFGSGERRFECLAASCDALLALDRPEDVYLTAETGRAEAEAAGDHRYVVRFSLFTTLLGGGSGELDAELSSIAESLLAVGDEAGAAQALEAAAHLSWDAGRTSDAMDVMDHALDHARRAKDRQTSTRIVAWLCDVLGDAAAGTEAAQEIEALDWVGEFSPLVEVKRLATLAALRMRVGASEQARKLITQAASLQEDLGQPGWVTGVPRIAGEIELATGDPAAAERILAEALTESERVGHPDADAIRSSLERARSQRREHL